MNRLLLFAPKTILSDYVLRNFTKLSVDDFFKVQKRIKIPSTYFQTYQNEKLKESSDVLAHMLDVDINIFREFSIEAFSKECIEKIAFRNAQIKEEDLDKFPVLLENKTLCESIVCQNPLFIKKIPSLQITPRIVSLLADSHYIPDENDFLKSPLFSQNERIVTRGIEKEPSLILKIPNLSLRNVSVAIRRGFTPKKEHFYAYPHLKKYPRLLEKAFETDPSMISFFDREHLSITSVLDANSRGYVANEKDLIENPDLASFGCIMENAIKKNPRMLVYLSPHCSINPNIIDDALQKYEITKEDLLKFPNITRNYSIMLRLPQFKLYSSYVSIQEKQKNLQSKIEGGQTLSVDELPFLDYRFGGKVDIDKLNQLLNHLKLNFHEDNMFEQQSYLQMLDKIIDGIVNMHYKQEKSSFLYADIASFHNDLMHALKRTIVTKNEKYLYTFSINLYTFVGKKLSLKFIEEQIEKFKKICLEGQDLDLKVTSDFCNYILNEHRNHFIAKEKNRILKEIEGKMSLTSKKANTIWNGRKLQKVANRIKNKEWNQLGITEERFHEMLRDTEEEILNNKDVRKSGMKIRKTDLDLLANYFEKDGFLSVDRVQSVLYGNHIEVVRFISHKFEQIKFKLISSIFLSEEEKQISSIEKEKLGGLNHTNYVIADKNRYVKNLSSLILQLDDEMIDKILMKIDFIQEVSSLLLFLDLMEELDIKTFINIVSTYDRVRKKFSKINSIPTNGDYSSLVLKKIDDVIFLANAYTSINDITLLALGKKISSVIGEHNSSLYLDFYLSMFAKQRGSIPPICIQTSEYYVESGRYADQERLLIGKIPSNSSCIDLLNPAGVCTYVELLQFPSGDVALVKDYNKKLISRVFLFRRGNFVQMVVRSNEELPMTLYKKMADAILHEAILKQDNIDYVLINEMSKNLQENDYITIQNPKFEIHFPHTDFRDSAILLSSRKKVEKESDINLNFDAVAKVSYQKPRKRINNQPTEEEITRLRALQIIMEDHSLNKENRFCSFEPFYKEEYANVVCGEDWYIAIRTDGTLEELVLPSKDSRTYEEFEQMKESLGFQKSLRKIL